MLFKNTIIILLSFFIIGCGGTSAKSASFTSFEDVLVNGRVVKGPIKQSSITIQNPDTNKTLGSGITDDNGYYTINIKNYKGVVRVIAQGGSYIDEIDSTTQTLISNLEAISVVDSNSSFEVNITPYTTIAVKNMLSFTASNVELENKKVAKLFMGSEFDITKVRPNIYTPSALDSNSSENIYGAFLAAFAKVTDSNASNIDANITSFYNDMSDNIVGDSLVALNSALVDLNISATLMSDVNISSNKSISLQKIRDYADNNASSIPVVQDYINLGFTSVTALNIGDLNKKIEALEALTADTIQEIQPVVESIVDRVNVTITDGENGIATGSPVIFTFIFSDDINGFIADDIDVTGGTKGALTKVTDRIYTIPITPLDNSTQDIVVNLASEKVVCTGSNNYGNNPAPQVTQSVDTVNLQITYCAYADLNATDSDGDKIILYFSKDINQTTLDNINPQNLFDITGGKTISGDGNYTQALKIYTINLDDGATEINSSAESIQISIKPNTIRDINNNLPTQYPEVTFTSGTLVHNNKVYNEVISPDTNKTWLDRNLDATQICTASDDINCTGEYYEYNSTSCPTNFHIPTKDEFANESTNLAPEVDTTDELFASFLKIPAAGYKDLNGSMVGVGSQIHIWSSSVANDKGFSADDQSGSWGDYNSSFGYSIRCIKD